MRQKEKYVVIVFLLVIILVVIGLYIEMPRSFAVYHFYLPETVVESYGFYYPVTFMFSVPQNVAINCSYSYDRTLWNETAIVKLNESAVYVNVGFNGHADVYIQFSEPTQYLGIAKYYNNSKAVVTSRNDDFEEPGNNPTAYERFMSGLEEFQKHKIWFGCAVITGFVDAKTWHALQGQIDEGYVEVYSHSRTHPQKAISSSEIGGSKKDILDNLSLPFGGYELVYVAPYSYYDNTTRELVKENHYLVEVNDFGLGNQTNQYAPWNSNYDLFDHISTVEVDANSNNTLLNKVFDQVYADGGIYQLETHPERYNLSQNVAHLDYISSRKDVWYAPLAGIYLYRYVALFVHYVAM